MAERESAAQLSHLCLVLTWLKEELLDVKVLTHESAFALLPSAPAPDREKRDSQAIIDTLRDTLEERNATVESLQSALNKAEMLCSTLKVSPQSWWEVQPQPWLVGTQRSTCPCLPSAELKACITMPSLGSHF